MKRLFLGLCVLVLVFATSMSFVSLAVYELEWWWAVVGIAILVAFVALGGLLVPPSRKAVPEEDKQTEGALLQAFGAFCGLLFLIMALVTWILGARQVGGLWYQILGLLIFLALIGIGIQGAVATMGRLFYVWNTTNIDRRQAAAA
ncbi:MAG: hypothetical protein ACLP9C_04665 [Acidimicrobiales bacterium]